jgi:hypothetical protein
MSDIPDESSANASPQYEVGYGKPPKQSRFKKGQSGNPKGRPKGALNVETVLSRVLRERVVINQNGRRKVVTKLEAALMQLVNKSASGDPRALRLLLDLTSSYEERSHKDEAAPFVFGEADLKLLNSLASRYQIPEGEGDGNGNV